MILSAVCSLVLVSLCSLSGAVDVCSLSGAVDVKVQGTKPVGSSDDKFQLKGSCTYQMTGRVDAKGVVLTVQFDKDTMKFKSWKAIVLTSNSTTYHVTNKRLIKRSQFKLVFTVQYTGTDVPSGTCSELQIITNGDYNYDTLLRKSILFYAAQRSGDLPEGATNPVPWRKDSALYDGQDVGVDLTGGWYDAGDYVKFNFPISSATAVLAWGLAQWRDAYVYAGLLDEMLDSIKWPLDYFLKCWRSGENVYYAQVGDGNIDHDWMGRPEDMTPQMVPRPAYYVNMSKPGSDVAACTAAAFAAGSIAFKETEPSYSADLLDAAKSLYAFADQYRGIYTEAVPDAEQFYPSSGFNDDLLYAAAMLYKATEDQMYLTDAENKYVEFGVDYWTSWAFDWSDKLMGAKLLLYEATRKQKYSRDVTSFLQSWFPGGSVQYTHGGLAWRQEWGPLRYSANSAFIALMAADLGINPVTNINWAQGQIHYMLGDNPRQSSYVVGYGNNPPKRPHHKGSTCQPSPAPCNWSVFHADTDNAYVLQGALVGGPDSNDNYIDNRTDYVTAEVTCDYNAGFQSAVAGLQHFKLQE